MDFHLSTSKVFDLADVLGMVLEYDNKTGHLFGEQTRTVCFGKIKAMFGMKIVSSKLTKHDYMVMTEIVGNLGLLVMSRSKTASDGLVSTVTVHVLNRAKMDRLEGWLEKAKPADATEALKLLDKAVVKSFTKTAKNEWKLAA